MYRVLQLESPARTPERYLFGPREFALTLMSIGVVGPQNLVRTNGGYKNGRDDSRRQPTTEAAGSSNRKMESADQVLRNHSFADLSYDLLRCHASPSR